MLLGGRWLGSGGMKGFGGFGWQSGSCRLQIPMDGGSDGAACLQDSYLLAHCSALRSCSNFQVLVFFVFSLH